MAEARLGHAGATARGPGAPRWSQTGAVRNRDGRPDSLDRGNRPAGGGVGGKSDAGHRDARDGSSAHRASCRAVDNPRGFGWPDEPAGTACRRVASRNCHGGRPSMHRFARCRSRRPVSARAGGRGVRPRYRRVSPRQAGRRLEMRHAAAGGPSSTMSTRCAPRRASGRRVAGGMPSRTSRLAAPPARAARGNRRRAGVRLGRPAGAWRSARSRSSAGARGSMRAPRPCCAAARRGATPRRSSAVRPTGATTSSTRLTA